jgi:exonuclease I
MQSMSMSRALPAAASSRAAVRERPAGSSAQDRHVRAALAVLRMAAALEPDPIQAMAWYHGVPIAVLDGLTAAQLVRRGRVHAVLAFLRAAIGIDRAERRARP